ncbi:hypothetical protein [Marivivens aquimaris]|uniref:hypothetical protein n=1 Tax=Marivivens aquimaris TaxID=2774876 RepID=UPI001882BAA6|nr:hypothetical protein [Marivivens aquimaris]
MNAVAATPAPINLSTIIGLDDFETVTVKMAEHFSLIPDVGAALESTLDLDHMTSLSIEPIDHDDEDDFYADDAFMTEDEKIGLVWIGLEETARSKVLTRMVHGLEMYWQFCSGEEAAFI